MTHIIQFPLDSATLAQSRIEEIAEQCEHNFVIPRRYHSALSEYILTYWSTEYLLHRLEQNALMIERNDRNYNVVFDNTNLYRLIEIAREFPLHQVKLSFRRALPRYDTPNFVLIQSMYQPQRII